MGSLTLVKLIDVFHMKARFWGVLREGGKPGCNRVKVSQDVMDDRDTISKLGSHAILRSNPHKNQGSVHTNLQLSQVFPKKANPGWWTG